MQMRTTSRQRLIRWVLGGATVAGCVLWRYNESTYAGLQLALKPFLEEDASSEPRMEYCSAEDIAQGTWIVNRDFDSYEDIFQAYGLQSKPDTTCHVPPPEEGTTRPSSDTTPEEEQFQRIKAVAIPALQPRGDCTPHGMDAYMMLKRLLRSPTGMTIIGDSLSQYSYQVWVDMLQSLEPGLLVKDKVTEFHFTLRVDPTHDSADSLVRSSGITTARLTFPVLTFHRSDLLLTPEEIPRFMGPETDGRIKIKLQRDTPEWYPLWVKLLGDAQTALFEDPGEGEVYTETSVLVVTTGAHWNVGTLSGGIEEEEFVAGYRNMFISLSENITTLPFPVSSFWRSLAPAHVDCVASTTFNNARLDWSSPLNGHMNQWNYQWYTWMNIIARRYTLTSRTNEDWDLEGIVEGRSRNPGLRYFNVWDMSLKRPEAHLRPPKDCLHWCMIGVMNYWQGLLWNMIVQESRSDDYDVLL